MTGDSSIVVTSGVSPSSLVEDTLVSGCVEAFNVVYTGDVNQASVGYFEKGSSISFPFESP